MSFKSILTMVLVVFVAASVVYLVVKESGTTVEADSIDRMDASVQPEHHLIAYYFHGTKRCKTCLKIESSAKLAIENNFSEEIKDGLIEWKAVNFEEEQNADMATRYELVASSLVIVEFRDGKETQWKTLEKVWELVWDDEPFASYVTDEVKVYLNSEKSDG